MIPIKPKPLTHRARVIIPPGQSEKPTSIDDFLSAESALMDAQTVRYLLDFSQQLHEKLLTDQARAHADLHDGVRALLRALESPEASHDPLPKPIAEAAAALAYVLKGADIIPDWIPEIGLTDDARVVARVLERNPSLR